MRKISQTERSPQKRFLTMPKAKKIEPNIQQTYKYYIGPGNNSNLIRRILSTRKQWQEVTDSKYLFLNFKWQQTDKSFKYESCLDNKMFKHCFNHFQFHRQLSDKENMFKNLQQFCQSQKIDVFDIVPLTFTLNLSDSSFDQHQSTFLKVFQNNLPEHRKISDRKQYLFLKRKKIALYKDLQLKEKNLSKFQVKDVFLENPSKYLWILKPTSNNRGNGIHVFNTLQSLQNLINSYLNGQVPGVKPSTSNQISSPELKSKSFRIRQYTSQQNRIVSSFVVQKYLERPLLHQDRKFDIRLWVLVTHQMKVYLFKQGYMRTSSSKYSTNQDAIVDLNVHLTNNAVQKHNIQYGKYQDGNQLSFKILKNLIENCNQSYTQAINRIKWIIKLTMLSVRKKLNKNQRAFSFQIFGYDFMFDENCKPWLIQVNTNPCIEQSSVLLQNLLPRMLDDAFCLTLDRIYQTDKKGYNYSLQNEYSTDNLWQLIVDLKKVTTNAGNSQQLIITTNSSQLIN